MVRNLFANAPDALADFGMVPKKTAKPTLLTKVVASEKRAVMRDARHTMGKKEKLEISGGATPTEIATSLSASLATYRLRNRADERTRQVLYEPARS